MTIVNLKIHPALGIARIGNSPDEFFIGPERPWDRSIPPGGYKDNQCRVKRQAAQFRIFAYHDDGSVKEITAKEADITWTVHLANKKATVNKRNPAGSTVDLTIDPGPRLLTGPNLRQLFDTGSIKLPGTSVIKVPLGEARTDDQCHLLVLGGFGESKSPTSPPSLIKSFYNNAGWYDDISDGPVTAIVHIHATDKTFTAEGAWVVVAPPKFAPGIDNVITLYDLLYDMAVTKGWFTEASTPSYTQDIYPILESARTIKWVQNPLGAHTWPHPVVDTVQRGAIFTRLSTDMPRLNLAALTPTQLKHMEKWKDGTFTNDWTDPPKPSETITPAGLDKAALENAVGAAFWPGIEVGGIGECLVAKSSNYVAPFRLNHSLLGPGDLSAYMALPWQADFKACGQSWWPVPRPNDVIPQGRANYEAWDRDIGYGGATMAEAWHTLGFVIKQGNEYVEVDRCAGTFITLLTPTLNFQDIPQGPMGMSRTIALSIVFEVKSTGVAVTLEFQSGPTHSRLKRLDSSVTIGPTVGNEIATSKLWVTYETGPVGEILNDQVVIHNPASDQTWNVLITANTVDRKIVAAALILDSSGSMSEDQGDGNSKNKNMKEAASIFVDLMLQGDGVAIVRYNQEAQILQGVTPLGSPADAFDITRVTTKNILLGQQLNPSGATSIGDGIHKGQHVLKSARGGYDVKALVVLTDNKENREPWIADAAAEINQRTYSIGLGAPENIGTPALQTISGNHGGYLLVTGDITIDNRFILQKYFMQILAEINSSEIVIGHQGDLIQGSEHRVPFTMTEADTGMDVILLTPNSQYVDFRLQTPNGFIIEPWQVSTRLLYVLSNGASYYRVVLPVEMQPLRFDQAGTWHVLLKIGSPLRDQPNDQQSFSFERGIIPEVTYRES
jgi:hypothetical protein